MTADLKNHIRRALIHGGMGDCDPRDIDLLPIVDARFSFMCEGCSRIADFPWELFAGDSLENVKRVVREAAQEMAA